MLEKACQLLNDSGGTLYILAEGRGETFELQHGRSAAFASELAGKTFTLSSLPANHPVPEAVVEPWGQLAQPGYARPFPSLQSFMGKVPGLN